jgi:hypothetical protein
LFTLRCACGGCYLFELSHLQTYALSESAYLRGFGTSVEIVPTTRARKAKAG